MILKVLRKVLCKVSFKMFHKVPCKDASRSDLPQDLSQNLVSHLSQNLPKDLVLHLENIPHKKRLPKKPFSVPRVGIEPTCPRTHDFESCASTNSAI